MIDFPRADPDSLTKFDTYAKVCVMNCGPHIADPRNEKERKFLCNDCDTRYVSTPNPPILVKETEMSTIETVSAETTKVVESMTYLESIDYLSSLEFENDTLFNEETLPLNVSIATTTVAAIFRKSESDVISDLTDQRQQEIKDVNDNNDFRYGHNSQPDE